jgi:hypothetical protein
LVAPDIPVLTITSGRSNFLRSSLRRFEEAYLFSNEGDLALRLASTAANYFSFPAKSRTQGYRLGNVTVRPKDSPVKRSHRKAQTAYGILNLPDAHNLGSQLLEYLEINVLNKRRTQSLDPVSQSKQDAEPVGSPIEDHEAIANLFTYFDCTEYKDQTDYPNASNQDAYVLVLNRQRSPLNLGDYLRLFTSSLAFSEQKFPKKGRDMHGGYFWGKFSQRLIYHLAFSGFQGFLEALLLTPAIELELPEPPDPLKSAIAQARAIPMTKALEGSQSFDPEQVFLLRQRRQTALDYFAWICAQKQLQVVLSPERYLVDVMGRDREDIREKMLLRNR